MEEVGIAGVALGLGGELENAADVFRKPGITAGSRGDKGFVHTADDEVRPWLEE